jgi:peptidoglycan/xylan/chitin deacetylase (PgdA/CDA1 family)
MEVIVGTNLVAYSLKTKGGAAFGRRLWTVFTRFGFTEGRTRRSFQAMIEALRPYDGAPTFFVPATVLDRSPHLIRRVQRAGAEIGIHGYVHNDYRTLLKSEQVAQISEAMALFRRQHVSFEGFRNPYLGWNEDSLEAFRELGFVYDSNEAIIHDVIAPATLPPALAKSLRLSLDLFQAIPYTAYNLRPHTEDGLLRIPTSIPDDEMLFDRLRLPADQVGEIWSEVMRRVYAVGGVYVLNLHPERGTLARGALDALLATASEQPLPIWVTRLCDIAVWRRERAATTIEVTPAGARRWQVATLGSPRAALIVRNGVVSDADVTEWPDGDQLVSGQRCVMEAAVFPGVAISPRTPVSVEEALREQGYPITRAEATEAANYAMYVDRPAELGQTRRERQETASALVHDIERGAPPLARIGLWPEGKRAALSVTGDVDSVTIQDFFLRIMEVRRYTPQTARGGKLGPASRGGD